MKTQSSLALAAAVLLAGVSATAAGTPPSNAMSPAAKDTLTLSSAQQETAWHELYTKSLNQTAPPGFEATAGAVVPKSVITAPVTTRAAHAVPALAPYRFAMLQKKLVIVYPSDHKIADVIAR